MMTYELCVNGRTVAVEYSEDAMRALIQHMGYRSGTIYRSDGYDVTDSFSETWPLRGFNAVMAVLEGPDYCDCGAVHSGVEDMGRCEACGKVI